MSISYFAALLLLGCIFTTSIGGIVRRQDDDCNTPEFDRCVDESNSSQFDDSTLQGERDSLEALLSVFCPRGNCMAAAIEVFSCRGIGGNF